MPVTQQTISSIYFKELKGLKDLEISFSDKSVTAILGKNGCGKSTILHALACLYNPITDIGEKNYFTRFFKRVNGFSWNNSSMVATFNINGHTSQQEYSKGADRWKPRTDRRPNRDVVYIGIDTCVPDIEKIAPNLTNLIMVDDQAVEQAQRIISSASLIMNINYSEYVKNHRGKKIFSKVTTNNGNGYSSLSMGAGEQKLFQILEILYAMPPYSLLLIDELDLTLHTSALVKLIAEMVRVADNKHMQIVFTTHREEVTTLETINIRHIWNAPDGSKSFILNHTTPECLERLTGSLKKQLEVYVEDNLAQAIARQVVLDEGMLRYVAFHQYGAIENAFVVAAGLDIQEADVGKCIILLDGDKYQSEDDRMKQMKKCYSGTEDYREQRRIRALSHIKQFILPDRKQPEQYLWEQLKMTNGELSTYANELVPYNDDKHRFLKDVCEKSGDTETNFFNRLTLDLHSEPFWNNYVVELQTWLREKKGILGL